MIYLYIFGGILSWLLIGFLAILLGAYLDAKTNGYTSSLSIKDVTIGSILGILTPILVIFIFAVEFLNKINSKLPKIDWDKEIFTFKP